MRPSLDSYAHLAGGKVRDLYTIDDEHLLLVASDRISAYDHVLGTTIPDKGRVLTAMSVFFFGVLGGSNHLAGEPDDSRIPEEVLGRALVVRKLEMVPIECVARGYLTGSGLIDYNETGSVCGVPLPEGLVEASRLLIRSSPRPARRSWGARREHHLRRRGRQGRSRFGDQTAGRHPGHLRQSSQLRRRPWDHSRRHQARVRPRQEGQPRARRRVLTPDSSRYWPADGYEAGKVQPSFDKQFVRNWLTSPESGWDRASDTPPPPLPAEIVAATRQRYIDAYERISGLSFAEWVG